MSTEKTQIKDCVQALTYAEFSLGFNDSNNAFVTLDLAKDRVEQLFNDTSYTNTPQKLALLTEAKTRIVEAIEALEAKSGVLARKIKLAKNCLDALTSIM